MVCVALRPPIPTKSHTSGQVVRYVGHALHATGHHHVVVAQHDALGAEHQRLHAGGAHLVDGGARGRFRDSGAKCRLTRRSLAHAGLQDIAEDHFVDVVAGDAGALETGADCNRTQFGGRYR